MKIPTLLNHKGYARVRIAGKDIYLGKHGSDESQKKYYKLCAAITQGLDPFEVASQWNTHYESARCADDPPFVSEVAKLWAVAEASRYASPTGRSEGKTYTVRRTVDLLTEMHPGLTADEFKPRHLADLQATLANAGKTRTYIRDIVNMVRACFRWAVTEEFVPADTWHALLAVQHLSPRKSQAREPRVVQSVPIERVDATLPHLATIYQKLVTFQLLTGARPGEAIYARWDEITADGPDGCWVYRPELHKTASRGKSREIPIGPKLQLLLADLDRSGYVFGDDDPPCGVGGYRHAVTKACERAFNCPPELRWQSKHKTAEQRARAAAWRSANAWYPYQLRHLAGTEIARVADLEHVAAVLGHASTSTSRIYVDHSESLIKAASVAAKHG